MATKKRRGPKHPGVVLIRPDPERHIGWRARYRNPDSGKVVKVSLDSSLTTSELRQDWAARKANALAKRRVELEGGAPRATGTTLADALEHYFRDHPQLRALTVKAYRSATAKLTAWCLQAEVRLADDLTGPKLVAFRASLVRGPRRVHAKGGKRGERETTDQARSPHTVNRELRSVGTVLGYVRRLGLLPKLTADELRDALGKLPVNTERLDYLKPHELQKLLEAALRHDGDRFAATREELAGLRPVGSTRRYEAVAPFVALVLLTGMRFAEAAELDWERVDLDALDNEGNPVGEVYLTAATKTKKARTVGLEVSPALRKILAALKLKSGREGKVFKSTAETLRAAERRLKLDYGAPAGFGWQALRRTCGTFLTNAPGIFGAASAYRSAKQLGHSVQVAEKHYLDVARGIPRDARTLEAAMQIEEQIAQVVETIGGRGGEVRGDALRKVSEHA